MSVIGERLFIGSNGLYTAEARESRRLINAMLREAKGHLQDMAEVTG